MELNWHEQELKDAIEIYWFVAHV